MQFKLLNLNIKQANALHITTKVNQTHNMKIGEFTNFIKPSQFLFNHFNLFSKIKTSIIVYVCISLPQPSAVPSSFLTTLLHSSSVRTFLLFAWIWRTNSAIKWWSWGWTWLAEKMFRPAPCKALVRCIWPNCMWTSQYAGTLVLNIGFLHVTEPACPACALQTKERVMLQAMV